jgi:hypothetical protein
MRAIVGLSTCVEMPNQICNDLTNGTSSHRTLALRSLIAERCRHAKEVDEVATPRKVEKVLTLVLTQQLVEDTACFEKKKEFAGATKCQA